jgi:2-dehydropantoate 2-reductase
MSFMHENRRGRIAVVGSGANGASIGADLTRAGHDVTLIEQWPEHVEAMRARGLTVVMPHETQVTEVSAMHLCDVATLRTTFDVVLLLVKAYDTRWATHLIEPYLADDGLLVGVQNGMTLDAIADVVGAHRTLGCVIEISSGLFVPGVVERHSPRNRSWFAVGSDGPAARGRENDVAQLLELSGPTVVVDDIRATKWMKLVSNATTLVPAAVVGLPLVEALELPGMRRLMLRSGQEALDAGLAQGLDILPIFGLGTDDVSEPSHVVETLLDTLVAGFVLSNTTTTVLQDWGKGRRSEAGDVNGRVVAELAAVGRAAPVNAALVEMAGRIESGELEPSPSNVALLHESSADRASH